MIISNIADYLIDHAAPSAKPEWLADLLDRLLWLMADNGAEILAAVDRWLIGADRLRVEVALQMKEPLLAETRDELATKLIPIRQRWPDLGSLCDEALARFEAPR